MSVLHKINKKEFVMHAIIDNDRYLKRRINLCINVPAKNL